MRLNRPSARPALLAVAAVAALAACSSGTSPAPGASPSTSAPTVVASPSPTASATPDVPVVAAPAECDAVSLAPGATVTGADLSACVIGFSLAAGSGHEHVQSGDSTAEVDFVFSDAPAMTGTMVDADGTTSFVLTQDRSWITIDGRWVEGDITSSDSEKVLAGTVGTAYRTLADPSVSAGMIAMSPTYTVQPDQDVIDLVNGGEVHAWRLQSDAPSSMAGVDMQELIVWLADGHVVVGTQGTGTFGGVQTTTVQQFTDWGVPVVVEPPVG
ncbi:hypothetical protein [Cellulomonas iranensis]|uniref:hypothetical protein n=1 Tax=Cellulomonas iranensis TaxID=76862 RepID=UPI001F09CB4A|nr:hypothetical protein [Cellulomonas iranensis]